MSLQKYTKNTYQEQQAIETSQKLLSLYRKRRSTRFFTDQKIDQKIINNAIATAGSAPSGANRQPWLFCSVSCPQLKKQIRQLSEAEEENFYVKKPNKQWVKDLEFLHPKKEKPYLEYASHLILVFYKNQTITDEQEIQKNYYAKESTGIATGMLISALHLSGVSTLTYTPRRMKFMQELLEIDKSYIPFMLVVAGIAPEEFDVPMIKKKDLEQISKHYH